MKIKAFLFLLAFLNINVSFAFILIDNFNYEAPAAIENTAAQGPSTGSHTDSGGGNILGDQRSYSYDYVNLSGSSRDKGTFDVYAGQLSIQGPKGGDGSSSELFLTYDANGAGLGGVDMLQDGANVVRLVPVIIDTGNTDRTEDLHGGNIDPPSDVDIEITLTLTDTSNNSHSVTLYVPDGSQANIDFELSLFQLAGVDTSSINSVEFNILADGAADIYLDSLGGAYNPSLDPAVPEPTTILGSLAAIGIASLAIRRKKRATG